MRGHEILRRALPCALILAGAVTDSVAANSTGFDTPAETLEALRKIHCSLKDGNAKTFWWHGKAFSRVPGEPDRTLFQVEGMNIRQCGPLEDKPGAVGFNLVSREILLYKDPITGEVLRDWQNPWTGKTVEVIHVSNDPVNGKFTDKDRNGQPLALPFSVRGDQWWLTLTIPLFYKNPLGGDFQPYVCGMYQATEMFNYFGNLSALQDASVDSVNTLVGWARMSSWLPWMEMGDRAGFIYFHTAGQKLKSFDDLSDTMKAEIAANYPAYTAPPPLDDDRPNETSWTFFRKSLAEQ